MYTQSFSEITFYFFQTLIESQNISRNLAVNGAGLCLIFSTINFGLQGPSYDHLSDILQENFKDLRDAHICVYSSTAKKLNNLKWKMRDLSKMPSRLLYSFSVDKTYEKILESVFNVFPHKVKSSDPTKSPPEINELLSARLNVSIPTIPDESMFSKDRLIFISSFFYQTYWHSKFHSQFTKRVLFYDVNGKASTVEMKNKKAIIVYSTHMIIILILFYNYSFRKTNLLLLYYQKKVTKLKMSSNNSRFPYILYRLTR
ncbi:hypothetical protein RF11_14699 [Thelohanellus kitauei]|uniref:Serpin domain-containing protein n=1 Tax=Thelohanellus kitauei TaxID=669202 RepID=A0A0C2M2F8_THEKT|nr:hypothetical protein RF11_14699 [Thelohanellus kitauei]